MLLLGLVVCNIVICEGLKRLSGLLLDFFLLIEIGLFEGNRLEGIRFDELA